MNANRGFRQAPSEKENFMYHHVKKLMYMVNIGEPDPKFGRMLLEQFGGANGELAAAMQYSIHGFNCEDAARKDLLMDIGTEELSHLEVVGALIRMHLKPMKSDREAAEADPLVAIAGGGGVSLFDSMGNAWTADYLKVTGDLAVDLRSNIAAEARAKIVYERLIGFTQDQGSKEALQFLMTREITHMRAFTAALDSMNKPQFSVGIIQPTPTLVDQFFNGSTGESQYGEADFVGPWNHSNGLVQVESEVKGGEGLDVTPYTPQPGTEVTSLIDSTPVGQYTSGVGKKQAAIHAKAQKQAAEEATVEV
jgi:Mn-containing catalase